MIARSRSWRLLLLAVPLFVMVGVALSARDAGAVTEDIAGGQITVTIEPTDQLVDGQVVTVTVVANRGVTLNEVRANQCVAPVDNNFSHSMVGGFCIAERLSPNSESQLPPFIPEKTDGPFAPGTVRSEFTYRVGVGEQVVNDVVTGESRTVRCGPEANDADACYLDLWIQQSLNPEVHYAVPLRFRDEGPVTTTTEPGSTTTVPATTTTTTTTTGPTTTEPASTTTTEPDSTTTTTIEPGSTTTTTEPDSSTTTTGPTSSTTTTRPTTSTTTLPTSTTATTLPSTTTTTTAATTTTGPSTTTTTPTTTTASTSTTVGSTTSTSASTSTVPASTTSTEPWSPSTSTAVAGGGAGGGGSSSGSGQLPVTGGGPLWLVLLGLMLGAAGAAALAGQRWLTR